MDSLLLRAFLILSETKNFTQAAHKLRRSQSAVSLQISRLENLLGKQLFIRDNRNVVVTSEGERLVGYAQQLLHLEEEILTLFQKPQLTGEVTFGTPEDVATAHLPGILSNFTETYPGITLNVHCEFTEHLLNGFNSQLYDLVLIKQDPQSPHPKSEPVWKESLVWVGTPTKIHTQGHYEGGKVIPLVLAPSPCVYRQRAIDALNRERIPWRIVYTSPSVAGTIAAVKAGLGVAVLPINMVTKGIQILRHLPVLKDAQIALLKQDNASTLVKTLANYIVDHILADSHSL